MQATGVAPLWAGREQVLPLWPRHEQPTLAASQRASCPLRASPCSRSPLRVPRFKRPFQQEPTAPACWPQSVALYAEGLGRSRLLLCRGPWPQPAAPAGGMAMTGHPILLLGAFAAKT
ncbi:hypothetical protein BHM03_00042842 [Ensete ventricosum]|nr:hypothetical protein BHM03_00042842 [Ensete ventricosum]